MPIQTVMITRPSGQAQQFIESLHTALQNSVTEHVRPAKIIALPLLEIAPNQDAALGQRILNALQEADLAIFVSPSAIECVLRLLNGPWQDRTPKLVPIGVMGAGSRQALQKHGIGLEVMPTPIYLPQDPACSDSDGLWNVLQQLHWRWPSKKVIIFKGEGGRDWLAKTLKETGATVDEIDVYTRIPLEAQDSIWKEVDRISLPQSLWLLTSSEATLHLARVMQEQFGKTLQSATALCSHANIAATAKAVGFGGVVQTESGDAAVIQAILNQLQA
jgi:uroporphyrinogen-III synthase